MRNNCGLSRFSTAKHPRGLGNANGLVGKYLLSHPSVSIFGMFDEDMQNYLGATGGQLFNQDRFAKTANSNAFGSWQWEIALALKPNDLLGIAMSRPDLFGSKLDKFMHEGSRGLASMVGVCEEQPQLENRVELAAEKDKFGIPLAKVVHSVGQDGRQLWQLSAQEGIDIFKAAGAKSVWHSPAGGQHIMGGAIMGNDPATSVTNGYAQMHQISNLVIGGPSVFPTSSCVNSTFTAHALALKSAEYLIANG
ncbi:MAG: GMC family oxidoreductase [Pseudomonadales bacterium]